MISAFWAGPRSALVRRRNRVEGKAPHAFFRTIAGAIAGCLILFFAVNASAQPWPAKPIRLIVPFPPGGPTDLVGREAAIILRDALGATVHPSKSPEEFVAYIRVEHARWGEVIKSAGVKIE